MTSEKGSHSAPPLQAYDGPSWHDCYDGPFSRPVCFLPSPPDLFRRGHSETSAARSNFS
nr:MAG TPA: hypothetical protein [Caudoviricetes sp.]